MPLLFVQTTMDALERKLDILDEFEIASDLVYIKSLVGKGKFSKVYELEITVDGRKNTYVGKQLLLADSTPASFYDEMTKLYEAGRKRINHQNIVPFYGLFYHGLKSDSSDHQSLPIIVTEKMEISLLELLKTNLNDRQKFLILRDVACGLQYLHTHPKRIIHGDLTARNVFVNKLHPIRSNEPSLIAKISDTGISSIVNQGICPTWECYRSALSEGPSSFSLFDDIYSYGVLAVYVFLRALPKSMASCKLEQLKDNSLYEFIIQCLHKENNARPSASMLLLVTEAILDGENPSSEKKVLM